MQRGNIQDSEDDVCFILKNTLITSKGLSLC